MTSALASASNLIGGGYAIHAAGWVSGGRGRWELGEFFGLVPVAAFRRRLDVGAEGDQAEVGGGCLPTPRRILENGGFASVWPIGRGDVARPGVARIGQGADLARVFRRRRQIANLTTRAAQRIAEPRRGAIGGGTGTPPVPPFAPESLSQAPWRSRRAGTGKSFQKADGEGIARDRMDPGLAKCREVRLAQMGSGVAAARHRKALSAVGAESSRNAMGRGDRLAHRLLDVGEAAMLRAIGRAVNGVQA